MFTVESTQYRLQIDNKAESVFNTHCHLTYSGHALMSPSHMNTLSLGVIAIYVV